GTAHPAAPHEVAATVPDDAVEPRAHRLLGAEAVEGGEEAQQRVLCRVEGVVAVAHQLQRQEVRGAPVGDGEILASGGVAAARATPRVGSCVDTAGPSISSCSPRTTRDRRPRATPACGRRAALSSPSSATTRSPTPTGWLAMSPPTKPAASARRSPSSATPA